MKIYTRKGDEGQTSLIGGTRVPKYDLRIEAYGTVDELNAHLGLLRDQAISATHREYLLRIQDCLFVIGSRLAADPERSQMKLPELPEAEVESLEQAIDRMDSQLPEMRSFVLPGGHPAVSVCHIARCVCRRAERRVVELSGHAPVEPVILRYLNRLSDHLFVLSRKLAAELGVAEQPWNPKP